MKERETGYEHASFMKKTHNDWSPKTDYLEPKNKPQPWTWSSL